MMRGLVRGRKQPIWFSYDTNMDMNILFDIITHVERAGITECTLVSDLGGQNRKIHKEYNIDCEKPFFSSPTTNKIFVFADAPHLLKLIRINFIDNGFLIFNDKSIHNRKIIKFNK